MTKKKVTAPLTYNPGKGRPKEHLAYLNYQEMQALKRLNGNNQERGPRGLPSFPPAGAMSGGSAKSPASTSRSVGAGSRPSSGGRDGGIRDSVGANRPSSSGSSRGDVGGRDSGTRGSVGANRPSSSGASRGDVAGRDGGIRNVAGANTPDKSAISSANRTNTLSAQKSPAFKADTGRTVNVGPMGTPVKVGAPASRPSIPKATVQSPMAGQGASFASPFDARIENFQRINDERLKSGALGPEGVPSVSQIAAENARRLNAAKMAQQYSQYRSPPRSYPAAPQGVYGPRVGVGTSYLGTTDMPGMITTGMTSPYSGTINPRFNAAQTLMAYEAEKRVPGKIQDRVPPTERFRSVSTTPSGRIATPGLISYPNLDRPMTNEEAIKQYSSFRNPTAVPVSRPRTISVPSPEQSLYTGAGQFGVPTRGKIQDRINVLPSPDQSLYTGRPGKTRGIGDVQLPQSQYSGYGAEGYSTLSGIPTPESSGLLSTKYPDYRPPSRSSYPNYKPPSESSAFDPSRLAAYDSNFGPELSASVGSDIEKALIGEASPTYPDYGPPGGVRSLEGFSPATPAYKNVSPLSPGSRPYDVRLGEVKISAPMGDENGEVVIDSTTIDKYVDSMPDLSSAEKANLRRSMIGKTVAGDGKLEFTTEEVLQMKDEAKGEAMVADGVAEDYGLVGEEAAKAAKKAGFPRNVYTNEDFLGDPDQLGLTREEVAMPLSPDDMAKVVNRSRALRYDDVDPYLTGPEKVRAKVSDVIERIVTFGAPTKAAVGAAKKLMSIESPEKFLSRPSYEQQALYEYAREANTRYRPGEAGIPQSYGPGGSETVGGGSRFGRDGLGGGDKGNSGIASLGQKPKGDETTTPTPDTPSTSPGRRPDIYYMWDLGINIPSPSDPNYNQYQTYLAERLAAQRAMGYI